MSEPEPSGAAVPSKPRPPTKAALRPAHKFVFDRLRWRLIVTLIEPPTIRVQGDDLFEDYRAGDHPDDVESQARAAVVAAISALVWRTQPATIRLYALSSLAGAVSESQLESFERRYRRRLRSSISAAINRGGHKQLDDLIEGRRRPGINLLELSEEDWTSWAGFLFPEARDEYYAAKAVLAELEADATTVVAPTFPVLKRAVKYVFSSGAPWELKIVSTEPLTFGVSGSRIFGLYLSGKRVASDDDRARTAVGSPTPVKGP
jgi:hypothetical protein